MDTQILKLERPYDVIYCNGLMGLHIATMIVSEAEGVADSEHYSLSTHSHPVVKYLGEPGGVVWNKAELRDCQVVCNEEDKRVSMDMLYEYVKGEDRRLEEHDVPPMMRSVYSLVSVLDRFHKLGIEVEWPMLAMDGKQVPQDEFVIDLVVKENPSGSKYNYSCRDYGGSDIVYMGGAMLFYACEFSRKEDLQIMLRNYVSQCYTSFRDHKFKIVFNLLDGDPAFEQVINDVNDEEETIREEVDDNDI